MLLFDPLNMAPSVSLPSNAAMATARLASMAGSSFTQ
jgi:hypothetical protein